MKRARAKPEVGMWNLKKFGCRRAYRHNCCEM